MKKVFVWDTGVFLLGCILFAVSVNIFIEPYSITMGGFTGIATTISRFVPIPVGAAIVILNSPLLLIQIKTYGVRRGLPRAILGIAGTSVATDLLAFLPAFELSEGKILYSVGGGFIMGVGAGLLLCRGFTTGGSDLLAFIISPLFGALSVPRLILIIDAVIIAGSALVLRDFGGIVYSLAAVWCYSLALDKVISGQSSAVLAFVVSNDYDTVAEAIGNGLLRGVTLFTSYGWYSKKEGKTVMCVVRKSQLYRLKALVKETDPNAFVVVSSVSEVLGEGFKRE